MVIYMCREVINIMENLSNSLPIYIRIVKEIKDLILSGDLKEEGQLPSTTYISKKFNINVLTVNKAINMLVDEGLAYKKRGIGMFVKKGAKEQLIKERRETFKQYYVKATIVEAMRLGYTKDELNNIFTELYEELD